MALCLALALTHFDAGVAGIHVTNRLFCIGPQPIFTVAALEVLVDVVVVAGIVASRADELFSSLVAVWSSRGVVVVEDDGLLVELVGLGR